MRSPMLPLLLGRCSNGDPRRGLAWPPHPAGRPDSLAGSADGPEQALGPGDRAGGLCPLRAKPTRSIYRNEIENNLSFLPDLALFAPSSEIINRNVSN
jgi:hypothetical protein